MRNCYAATPAAEVPEHPDLLPFWLEGAIFRQGLQVYLFPGGSSSLRRMTSLVVGTSELETLSHLLGVQRGWAKRLARMTECLR